VIKILHRVNRTEQFPGLDPDLGVEMDVHAYGERLVVHHDALQDGVDLSEWLSVCGDRFVIFNIKEEGIESRVREMVLESRLHDYFFLDLSFPALINMLRSGESRVAVRVSEYEAVENALLLSNLMTHLDGLDKERCWVWLDCFEGFPLSAVEFQRLKSSGLKICLVSPELHGAPRSQEDIIGFQQVIQNLGAEVDAVCTKFPECW